MGRNAAKVSSDIANAGYRSQRRFPWSETVAEADGDQNVHIHLSIGQAALRQGLVDEFLGLAGGEGLGDGAHRHLAVDRRRHPQALPVLLQIGLGAHVVHLDVVGQLTKTMEPSLKFSNILSLCPCENTLRTPDAKHRIY